MAKTIFGTTIAWLEARQQMLTEEADRLKMKKAWHAKLPRIGQPKVIATWRTGSRYICNPPVMDTDDDVLALVEQYPNSEEMMELGWTIDGEDSALSYAGGDILSMRMGTKNVIMTTSKHTYLSKVAATELAKILNLQNKKDRIKLFESVGCTYPDSKNDNKFIPGLGGLL